MTFRKPMLKRARSVSPFRRSTRSFKSKVKEIILDTAETKTLGVITNKFDFQTNSFFFKENLADVGLGTLDSQRVGSEILGTALNSKGIISHSGGSDTTYVRIFAGRFKSSAAASALSGTTHLWKDPFGQYKAFDDLKDASLFASMDVITYPLNTDEFIPMWDTTMKLGTSALNAEDTQAYKLWNGSKYKISFDRTNTGEFNQSSRVFMVVVAYSPLAATGVGNTVRVDGVTTFKFKDI